MYNVIENSNYVDDFLLKIKKIKKRPITMHKLTHIKLKDMVKLDASERSKIIEINKISLK